MITIEIRALIRELSPKKVHFYTTFADPDYYNGRTVRWSAGRTFADDCIEIEGNLRKFMQMESGK